MKRLVVLAVVGLVGGFLDQAEAGELKGPGRFCGYSPIIDLLPGETITTLEGGVHAGKFRWEGPFGSLEVSGIGWASRPPGRIVVAQSGTRPALFAQRRTDGRYVVAIWNGAHAAAYFSSDSPFTPDQIRAIGRVALYQEGETPEGCNLRTIFAWD
jgi:hypothetical protein